MNLRTIFGFATLLASSTAVFGQNLLDSNPGPIMGGTPTNPTFNNPSFEYPDIASVGISAFKWEGAGPTLDVGAGMPLRAGTGVFENVPMSDSRYLAGMTGTQAGYLFANSFPDALGGPALDHSFTQITQLTLAAGQQYKMSIDMALATAGPPAGATFTFSLFAVDPNVPSVEIPLASTTILNNSVNEQSAAVNTEFFVPFSTTTGAIAGSAIGKNIGIRLLTHSEPVLPTLEGQWDFDNVQVTLVPEPMSLAMIAGGAGLLGLRRRR